MCHSIQIKCYKSFHAILDSPKAIWIVLSIGIFFLINLIMTDYMQIQEHDSLSFFITLGHILQRNVNKQRQT